MNSSKFIGSITRHSWVKSPSTPTMGPVCSSTNSTTKTRILWCSRTAAWWACYPLTISRRFRWPSGWRDESILTQPGTRPLEVRLLAVEPEERRSSVFFGLIYTLYDYAVGNGHTHLFISGVEERLDLYEQLGFVPIGAAVRSGKASFVPMVLKVGQLPIRIERMKHLWAGRVQQHRDKAERHGDEDSHKGARRRGRWRVCLAARPGDRRRRLYGRRFIKHLLSSRAGIHPAVLGRASAAGDDGRRPGRGHPQRQWHAWPTKPSLGRWRPFSAASAPRPWRAAEQRRIWPAPGQAGDALRFAATGAQLAVGTTVEPGRGGELHWRRNPKAAVCGAFIRNPARAC